VVVVPKRNGPSPEALRNLGEFLKKQNKELRKEEFEEEELTKAGANQKYKDIVERLFKKELGGPIVRFAHAFETNFSNIKKPIEVLNPEEGIALKVFFVNDNKLHVITVFDMAESEKRNKLEINYYSIRNIKSINVGINQFSLDFDEVNYAKIIFLDGSCLEINVPDTPIKEDQGQDMYRRRALSKFIGVLKKSLY
jgi:hypothetical protein